MAKCPVHHAPLICPKCIGKHGGQSTSDAKRDAVRRNIQKALAARWPKKEA